MKISIKKIILALVLNLCLMMPSFSENTWKNHPIIVSDSTVEITNNQLKETVLIFLEHQKNKEIIQIQDSIINDLENEVTLYCNIDSFRRKQLIVYKDTLNAKNIEISDLKDEINSCKKWSKIKNWIIGILSAAFVVTTAISIAK